jgi:hypothetical protein
VLDRGREIERGTHAQLLAAGGYYASMWARDTARSAPVVELQSSDPGDVGSLREE